MENKSQEPEWGKACLAYIAVGVVLMAVVPLLEAIGSTAYDIFSNLFYFGVAAIAVLVVIKLVIKALKS